MCKDIHIAFIIKNKKERGKWGNPLTIWNKSFDTGPCFKTPGLSGGVKKETLQLELPEVGSGGRSWKGIPGGANFHNRRCEKHQFREHYCERCKGGNYHLFRGGRGEA